MNQPVFHLENLRKQFRNGDVLNYTGCHEIPRHALTLITGPSGVGKSTLLNILGLLEVPNIGGGSLRYQPANGEQVDYGQFRTGNPLTSIAAEWAMTRTRRNFGYLPQQGHLPHAFSMEETLQLMWQIRGKKNGLEITDLLDKVGFDQDLQKRIKHSPANISGGQMQRLVLARALCGSPDILFADEPTTYLDHNLVSKTMNLFADEVARGCAVIVVTHEPNLIIECLAETSRQLPMVHFRLSEGSGSSKEFKNIELERQDIP